MNADDLRKPLSIGDIVGTGWRLYTENFARNFVIALRGTLWLLVPFVVAVLAILWMVAQGEGLYNLSGAIALLFPAWIVLFVYCAAQSLGEIAGISRLAFQSLSPAATTDAEGDLDGAAGEREALRFTRSRKFSFLGSATIQTIILGIVNFIFFIFFSVLIVFALFSSGYGGLLGLLEGSEGGGNPQLALLTFLLLPISLILFICFYVWLSMRITLAEQALAIERESGAIASIGQSWKLMKRQVLRSFGVVFLAGLISLPITVGVSIISQMINAQIFNIAAMADTDSSAGPLILLPVLGSYLVATIVGLLGSIIVGPFFKSVLTTLYFDIRNRKERLEA
ncbi:MAG: hypothetical protein AAFQ74_18690 [Cyanobacteria bacterium J06623_4]